MGRCSVSDKLYLFIRFGRVNAPWYPKEVQKEDAAIGSDADGDQRAVDLKIVSAFGGKPEEAKSPEGATQEVMISSLLMQTRHRMKRNRHAANGITN